MTMKTLETDVVGMQHRVTTSTRRLLADTTLRAPVAVKLRRDPKNVHDKWAIEVVLDSTPMKGMMIGYLPRVISEKFSPMIDSGEAIVMGAMLTQVRPDDGDGDLRVKWKKRSIKPKSKKRKSS